MAKIALAQMVEELRREVKEAVDKAKGEELQFRLEEITLEAQVEVSREGGGEGKLSFWVAEIGASGGASKTQTQKIVLTLKPANGEVLVDR